MNIFDKRLEASISILNSYVSLGKITINSNDENIDSYVTFSVKLADRLINELSTINPNYDSKIITNKFDYYEIGNEEVDRIMNLPYDSIDINLKDEILKPNINIPEKFKEDYYSHLNALFLNVLLNRLNSYSNIEKAENRALDARKSTNNIIQELKAKFQNK